MSLSYLQREWVLYVSTVAQNKQTKHWLLKGPLDFFTVTLGSPTNFYALGWGGWAEGCSVRCSLQLHLWVSLNPTHWTFECWSIQSLNYFFFHSSVLIICATTRCISGLKKCLTINMQTTTGACLTFERQKYSFVHSDYFSISAQLL